MSTEIRIPLTEIRVKFRTDSRRPITELDRMVMQAIHTGANSVTGLKLIFQLPERLLVECLIDLMDMALLALDTSGNGFQLTEFGIKSLEQNLTNFGERVSDVEEKTFLREDLTGRIGPRFHYDYEKSDIPTQHVLGSISYGEIERLLLQDLKKTNLHLHSVESIIPVRDGISLKVTVNKGGISGLPGYWNHLGPLLNMEAEKRTGINYATSHHQNTERPDDSFWIDTCISEENFLLTDSDHEIKLIEAIEQAHRHLLILSAHVSKMMLDKLKSPIATAIERGVRVDILFGLGSLDESNELHSRLIERWGKEMRKSSPSNSGNHLTTKLEPLDSDAKILIWDIENGSYQAIVGSYNWLYGLKSDDAGPRGTDVSIRLDDPRLIGDICSTISGWIKDTGPRPDSISSRWSEIGLLLAQQNPPNLKQNSQTVQARIIYDKNHDVILREGITNSTQRLLITSHKINRCATGGPANNEGKLDWLNHRMPNAEFKFTLITGKEPKTTAWEQEDQDRLEKLVNHVSGSMSLGVGTHARVLIQDDAVIVSSYNFLSVMHDKRQIGVMLKSPVIADALWNTFQQLITCRNMSNASTAALPQSMPPNQE